MKSPPSSFLRIAKHLNYQRTFLARDCARVDIPCFPYEAFDSTGTKINPWSIPSLVESVRSFSFSSNAMISQPNRSMLDFHRILENHFIFLIGATFNINRHFHKYETPKFPLYVIETLRYLGKSSKTMSYDINHGGTDTLYLSCDLTDVLVSQQTRKPVAYPDWWLQKHGDIITSAKAELIEDRVPACQPVVSEVNVRSGDIDMYKHTNWASYLKFCYESLTDHATANSYARMSVNNLDNGVKCFNLIYKDESSFGDNLTVQSWDSDTREKRVIFNVLKANKICFYCDIDFY